MDAILEETEILKYREAIANKEKFQENDHLSKVSYLLLSTSLHLGVFPIWTTIVFQNCLDGDIKTCKNSLGNKL